LKDLITWILVAVGLVYVISAHTSSQFGSPPDAPVAMPDTREAPHVQPVPPPQPPAPAAAFGGYPCAASDCAPEIEGYRWAQNDSITDPDECTGNTGAFIEGCRVYAQRAGADDPEQ